MRKVLGILVGFGLLAILFAIALITMLIAPPDASQVPARVNCGTILAVQTGAEARSPLQAGNLNAEQRDIVTQIIAIGKQRNLPPLAWQVAIQAGMTESGLRNLNYGDRDSLGIFQMRPSMGWGSPAEVTNVQYAINKFYDVLLKVPNWQEQRPGESAQDVERSAFPERYHRWEQLAADLIDQSQAVLAADCVQPVASSEAVSKAIAFAQAQLGKHYVWGATGPNSFDCSGLMLRAWQAAGTTLPRTSRQQYHAGTSVALQEAQAGDLLFWAYDSADPRSIHHVAMYLGDGRIIEAQQTGVPVHIRPVRFNEDELMQTAIRVRT